MENWEQRLREKLKNRPKRNTKNFQSVLQETIKPTLKKIADVLNEYDRINSGLGLDGSSIMVEGMAFTFKVLKFSLEAKNDNEVLVKAAYFDLKPMGDNEIIKSEEKTVQLDDITEALVGGLFADAFDKTKVFDRN